MTDRHESHRTFRHESQRALRRMMRHLVRTFGLVVLVSGPALAGQPSPPAQPLPCGWPLEVTGAGSTNVSYPDTDATYWVMPFDTAAWRTMTVSGQYPETRFFSFVSYLDDGNVVDSLTDADIVPDPGSANPGRRLQASFSSQTALLVEAELPKCLVEMIEKEELAVLEHRRIRLAPECGPHERGDLEAHDAEQDEP
jgi:hypothetical protein